MSKSPQSIEEKMQTDNENTSQNELNSPNVNESVNLKTLLLKTFVFTIFIVLLVFFAGSFIREPLTEFAMLIINKLGLFGLFFGIILTDTFTFPVPPDTYLLITVATDREPVLMLTIVCIASIMAGNLAYFIGPTLAKIPFFNRQIEKFRAKGERLFREYGVWAVVIAALTPIPFSIICWLSAIYKMEWKLFFFATFARIPRLVGYYFLFVLGWA